LLEDVIMTALRRRMIEDMRLAGLSEGTQKRYLTGVACLARAYNRSPERITEEQVRRHVLHLRDERAVARGTFQTHWYGIRFFYERTLGVDWALFSKKKWATPARSDFPWPVATRSAAGSCRA